VPILTVTSIPAGCADLQMVMMTLQISLFFHEQKFQLRRISEKCTFVKFFVIHPSIPIHAEI
jgi:hypothetical protein